jgi:WD40 repeat protein
VGRGYKGRWNGSFISHPSRLWDLESGHSLRTFAGHTDDVKSVAIIPDGNCGLSASLDRTVRLWDLESGQCVLVLIGDAPFLSIAINRTGPSIVWGDSLGGVHIIEIGNMRPG